MSEEQKKSFRDEAAEMLKKFSEGEGEDLSKKDDEPKSATDDVTLDAPEDALEPQVSENTADETVETTEETQPAAEPEAAQSNEPASQEAPVTEAPAELAFQAPPSMSPADQENFAKLSPEMQQWVSTREHQRDAGFNRKMQEVSGLKHEYEPVQAMFAPHVQELQAAGHTPATYIHELVQLDLMAQSDPLGYIAHVTDRLGLDKRHIAAKLGLKIETDPFGENHDPLPPAPQPRPVRQIQNPSHLAMQLENRRLRQAAEEREMEPHFNEIHAFRSQVDENGNLKYPDFDLLANDMANMPVDQIGLDTAYKRAAIYRGLAPAVSHPEIAQNNTVMQSSGDTSKAKATVAKALKAQRVAPSSPPATPNPTPDVSKMSTSELLKHNLAIVEAGDS